MVSTIVISAASGWSPISSSGVSVAVPAASSANSSVSTRFGHRVEKVYVAMISTVIEPEKALAICTSGSSHGQCR